LEFGVKPLVKQRTMLENLSIAFGFCSVVSFVRYLLVVTLRHFAEQGRKGDDRTTFENVCWMP
jgi:hypothetical protein